MRERGAWPEGRFSSVRRRQCSPAGKFHGQKGFVNYKFHISKLEVVHRSRFLLPPLRSASARQGLSCCEDPVRELAATALARLKNTGSLDYVRLRLTSRGMTELEGGRDDRTGGRRTGVSALHSVGRECPTHRRARAPALHHRVTNVPPLAWRWKKGNSGVPALSTLASAKALTRSSEDCSRAL